MNDTYIYHKPPRRSRYARFRRRLRLLVVLVALIVVVGAFIYANLRTGPKTTPSISALQKSVVTDNQQTFSNAYFKFRDTGQWVLDQKSSTPNRFLYIKYEGQVIEGQLDVYINQVPIALYLATQRVLPVRIVNGNSLQVTGVSDPCSNQYAAGAPNIVKEVSINDATMLCNPDDPQYTVVVSQIGSDYRLDLQRANGSTAQYVIIYTDQDLRPDSQSITNIVSSFQAL